MQMKPITTVCALVLVFGLCGCARALGHRGDRMQQLEQRFASADADHDGRLSREEARQGMPWVEEHFDAIDTARTGFIDLAQLKAFARQQARQRQGSGGGGLPQ